MENFFQSWVASRRTSALIAAAVIVVGGATLVGWLVDGTVLTALLPGRVAMNPVAAAATIALLTGVIVWAVRSIDRAMARGAAVRATLREGEIQYRLLVEGIQDYAIFLLDPAGNVSSWNEGAQRIMGHGREEIVGRNFSSFYPAEDLATNKPGHELLKAARQGRIRDEGWRVRRDGTKFWASTLITAIFDEDGNLSGFSKITRDMTAQRNYQLKLAEMNEELERRVQERTRELTEANRDLMEKSRENETFVYSVSHDLRSPLVNLQGFSAELELSCAELADSLNSQDVPEELRRRSLRIMEAGMQEPIHFIRTAVTRLSAIIDALLRLSRAGRLEYQIRDVDLNGVVLRIVDSMRVTLAERGAELSLHPLPPARGDATALEQVFANLIGNALNYLDPARQGAIEVGVLEDPAINEGNGPRHRTYFVRDNGLGIPVAHQAKVFQAFQRLHPLSASGEGMGLTIVRRVVERHGGRIWLESAEGQGTTFFVSLPASAAEESRATWPENSLEPALENTECGMDAYPKEELCHAH